MLYTVYNFIFNKKKKDLLNKLYENQLLSSTHESFA